MKFNKKASMELGISTVVVLVIAMVLIAGGIAFIRGFFNKGTNELSKGFDLSELETKPTGDNPLVFAQGTGITLKSGVEEKVKIGFFNKATTPKTTNISFSGCTYSGDGDVSKCSSSMGVIPIMTAVPKIVSSGDSFGFVTLVKASCKGADGSTPKLPSGKYICNIQAVDDTKNMLAENQFIFEVTP
jgi:hypothetical protein